MVGENQRDEPQNGAVGEFDLQRPGLEIGAAAVTTHTRNRGCSMHAARLSRVTGWTTWRLERLDRFGRRSHRADSLDWRRTQLAAAKERHISGDVCLFEPIGGRFVLHLPEKADRLYVADVSGDWREEIIVVSGNELHVYENPAANPRPNQPRLWNQQHYRRGKMSWNYYSP